MPESVAKEDSGGSRRGSKGGSPRRDSLRASPRPPRGAQAKCRVLLLDGSTMELDCDRKIRGHELLSKVCDSLNLVEKDYFGLLYEDRGDPRAWIDLDKRVSKMIKLEPWRVKFAVKFYPPEPSQLQEELTRYQLVLAVRKDLLEGRLPCSTVTHALLASYLLQSELGDFEESEVGGETCKRLKLVPASACTPELEDKVVELHKTHRGQTPAEAELNYLENAKKLAMYGVDLHPAKDSENVDITLGVCSSGLLVHRDKLRINRFAWPKILKISYKRHNFYVKLRPGEFEQFESTVGFKLASHRAAKKLWRTCVEHHTFFRLTSPEPAPRSALWARLGGKHRHSARTQHEARARQVQRAPPRFARTLSHRALSSRSVDAIANDDTMPSDAAKRHTMPPQPTAKTTLKDKKPPAGAVKVIPSPPTNEAKSRDSQRPPENGTDSASDHGALNNFETTPKKFKVGGFGLFGKKDKSPKQEKSPKSPKDASPKSPKETKSLKEKVALVSPISNTTKEKSPTKPSFTKEYEYTDTDKSPTKTKPFIQGAFSYEKPISDEKQKSGENEKSPGMRKAGLAFNYAPGEEKKLVESAEKRKTPEDLNKLITPGIDYVQSAVLKEQAKAPKSVDPSVDLLNAERAHHDPSLPAVVPAVKTESDIRVVVITGRYNPKNKKLDDANGTILVLDGVKNRIDGKIRVNNEVIDTKSGHITHTDPSSGKQITRNAHVDSKSGYVLLTSGVIDPKTGKIDPLLAQQYCFVEKSPDKIGTQIGKDVELVAITGKYDGKHKKLDPSHAYIEVSRAVIEPSGKILFNDGSIDPKTGRIEQKEPKTGKKDVKQAYIDTKTGNILVTTGVFDPRSGKVDSSLAQQFSIIEKDALKSNREVRLVVLTSKYDPKTKKLDPDFVHIDSVQGTLNGENGKIQTDYGVIDPMTGDICVKDPISGKEVIKNAVVDTKTGNITLSTNVIDPRTNKVNDELGQQYSIVDKPSDSFAFTTGREIQTVSITSKYDPKSKRLETSNGFVEVSKAVISVKDDKVYCNFGVLDFDSGRIQVTDPKTGKSESKHCVMDTEKQSFIITNGVIDPKTGKVDSSLGQLVTIVDKDAPIERDQNDINLVIITSKFDPKNKKLDVSNIHIDNVVGKKSSDNLIHSDFGVLDFKNGQITTSDPVTGTKESRKATIDPKTGNMLLTSGVVDPKTKKIDSSLGQQISIAKKRKELNIPGRQVQLVVITSKYDSKNKRLDGINGCVESLPAVVSADGKVHSSFGVVDPKTGKIEFKNIDSNQKADVKQAIVDPKSGYLVLNSGVVDTKTGKVDSSLGQLIYVIDPLASKKPDERYMNLVIITSKYDPKTHKLDATNFHVDTIPAILKSDGNVYSEYGVMQPVSGQITITDPITGRQDIKKASVDTQTGNLLVTAGVVDSKTGQVNSDLGQQISIVERSENTFDPVSGKHIELVVITCKYDPKNRKLNDSNGHVETSPGVIAADGKIHTNFGILDPKSGKVENRDPASGRTESKQSIFDPKTGHYLLVSGVLDPKTKKPDLSLAQQLCIVEKDLKPKEKEIYLIIITTRLDPKTKKIDINDSMVETIPGSLGSDGRIHTPTVSINPTNGEITAKNPQTGKLELKKAELDPSTGHFLLQNHVTDPKTGKMDPSLVQQYSIVNKTVIPTVSYHKPSSIGEISIVTVTGKYDPLTKAVDARTGDIDVSKGFVSAEDGKVHTDFGIIDPKSGEIFYKHPITGKQELKQAEIDPKTGSLIITTSVVDPKTGKTDTSYAQLLSFVDKDKVMSKAPVASPRASISPPRQVSSPIKASTPSPVETPLLPPLRDSSPMKDFLHRASPTKIVNDRVTPPKSSPQPPSPQKTSPSRTSPQKNTTYVAPVKPSTAPPEPPKRRIVKIMVIFTKLDPKTKKPDTNSAEVEHITGVLDPSGLIETKYGVIDTNKGCIVITDPNGQKQTKSGMILPETGQIFIDSGIVNPKTNKVDTNLGMLMSVAKQDDPVVEITTITGPLNPKTNKVEIDNSIIEHTKGKVDSLSGQISTKYGVVDPSNGVIFVTDSSGSQDTKPIHVDENNGQVTVTGVVDPKTGKFDSKLGQLIIIGAHIDPVVEVTTFVGKVDSKKGLIEPKHSVVESSTGQLNPENNKIDTKYGQIDLVKGTVTYIDPKTGKHESKSVKVDPATGQLLLRSGQTNPKSGKPDKDIGRLICLRIIQNKVDPVSGKQIVSNDPKNIKVDPKTNQIWTAGPKDPQTGEVIYTAGQIDPVTGYIITIYGRLDPKTGTINRTTDIDKSLIKVDPINGQVYTSTGEVDSDNQPLYSATQVDPASGEIYTKLGKIDPKTGRLILIKIYVITQKDEKGRVKEVDPKECTIDETTGRIITTKTVYLYQIVDPITGETIDVDPDDPRLKGARTTVTQTMTLSGKIDPVTGRIKTEYGDIDPDTGDIDPSTAVRDPVTGQLILHYSQIDPSHFSDKSGNYTIEKETEDLPANIDIQTVNRHKFSTFGKDGSPARGDEPKTFTEYTTSEHISHQGYVSSTPLSSKIPISQRSKKSPTPPVVVKTTTKQILTKTDEGVTHNVEEEIKNLGTGEVTYSTHTNKAEGTDAEAKSPYVTARAVTTRTATTHHDLDTKAKTQQMEEKTVAHTLTSSATRQEQRVLTQQVKTTVTTGDKLGRRGSSSSISSGDSGTPIDFEEGSGEGHYYTSEPGSYRTTTTSSVIGNVPFGSVLQSTSPKMSEHVQSASSPSPPPGAEVVSSQTISSKTRTVETITYKTEKNGVVETRVEQKITIQSDGDPIDHDRALAEAIQEATAMNPDMTVEKIEIQQQSTQP